MDDVPTLVALALSALFGLIGTIQLAAPRFVRKAYRRWDYSPRVRVATGILDVAAAVMLAQPSVRGWGIALAAILTFGSVVTLLNHRQYACAAAVIVLMAALVPAALAVPRADQVRFIKPAPQVLAETR